MRRVFEIQKLQHERVFDKILRLVFVRARSARFERFSFLDGRAGSFKEMRIYLTFEFAR